MGNIIFRPSEVWAFFQNHKIELERGLYRIAENTNLKVSISNDDGSLKIVVVSADDCILDVAWANDERECQNIVGDIYLRHLGYVDDEIDLDDEDVYINQEIIAERENEIDVLFRNMLFDLLDKSVAEDVIEEIADDVKEHTLEYIARRHGLPIYRPMYLEDEDGKDFYSEYPYEEMIFEDYNPIYEPTD